MEIVELEQYLSAGEDSEHQFKKTFDSPDKLAAEMVAFSNGTGGTIFVGVDDNGIITGLTGNEVRRLNQMISSVASQNVRPPINPVTQNIVTDKGLVLVITVHEGVNRPYQDKDGIFWVKSGSDKRKATSREEIQRLFQYSGLIHADESLVPHMQLSDLDLEYFSIFFEKRYGESLEQQLFPLPRIVKNLNIGNGELLNLTGALLFSVNPSAKLPSFIVKAGAFDAVDITTTSYTDSRDITGKMADIFRQTVSFVVTNLHHRQGDQNFNSVGIPEIPVITIEELIANALIHRDYFISAPIRVFIFRDRVEIISPGHLPNNLTIENIKA
jgi:ATP-dependent DNA helicase RecG